MIETAAAGPGQVFLSQIGRLQVRAALAIGRHSEAVNAARRARRRRQVADGALALEEAEALLNLFRYREALALATQTVRRNRLGGDVASRLRLVRAEALWFMGRVASARAELRRAEALAEAPLTRARLLEMAGLLAWKDQRAEEARAHLQEAFRLYADAGHADGLVRALEKEAGVARDAGRFEEALRLQAKRAEVAAATTRVDALAQARTDRGDLLAFLGRWDEARKELDLAVDLYRRLGDPREHVVAAPKRAMVDLARGDLASVRTTLARIAEAAVDASALRLRGEHRLLAADLHLAAGEEAASETAAAEAVALFTGVRCREGECRAHVRRAHALIALGRLGEAEIESRRAARLAPPARRDLSLLALLARGRSLLRLKPLLARVAFASALRLSDTRPGPVAAARLGLALAGGAGRDSAEVQQAVADLEAWGDRRFVAYGLADVQAVCGAEPDRRPRPPEAAAPLRASCSMARAVGDAALALLGSEPWSSRWAEAMRAVHPVLPWWRAAWVSAPGWELRPDLETPSPLTDEDVARCVGAGHPAGILDLRAGPLAAHPATRLHGIADAIAVPTPLGALYLDFREGALRDREQALALALELARLVGARGPEAGPEEKAKPHFPGILGRCDAMKALLANLARVAPSSLAVHIVGETGTGKEKVAHAIHGHSHRRQGPFVAVNASSLPDELFEAEMFGHTKGAFTGAVMERRGHVAAADGGTLFLDEVADLTPRAQAKLLRFLADGEYMRVGDSQTRRANVRVVTAANVALADRVRDGRFREDLMYRLTDFTLALPPLRERGEDLLLLARHFMEAAAREQGTSCPSLPADVARALRGYHWPGNIRQLRSEMSRLVVLGAGGALRAEQLSIRNGEAVQHGSALREARLAFERDWIARALSNQAGNRSRAAAALGISRQALVVKVRQFGL